MNKKDSIVAVDPRTFEVVTTFDYASETARKLGVSRQAVHQALQLGYVCKGVLLFHKTAFDTMFTTSEE